MPRTVPSLALQNPGNAVDAALWGTFKASADFFVGLPLFRARQTSVMSTNSGSWYAMRLNAVDVDTDSGHIANDSRYTCQVPGWYWLEGYVTWAGSGVQSRIDAAIALNGAIVSGGQQSLLKPGSDVSGISAAVTVPLAVGDYVEVWGRQNSGLTLNTFIGTDLAPALNALWIHS